MKYEIVNTDLRIASCSIADLTKTQIVSFLDKWEPAATIRELTFFYDEEEDYIVLNREHKNYELYKELVEDFYKLDTKGELAAIEESPESMKETLICLQSMIIRRKAKGVSQIVHKTKAYLEEFLIAKRLFYITDEKEGVNTAISHVYKYGFICGKRDERAKKHKKSVPPHHIERH